jgi:hypothetical protein
MLGTDAPTEAELEATRRRRQAQDLEDAVYVELRRLVSNLGVPPPLLSRNLSRLYPGAPLARTVTDLATG